MGRPGGRSPADSDTSVHGSLSDCNSTLHSTILGLTPTSEFFILIRFSFIIFITLHSCCRGEET